MVTCPNCGKEYTDDVQICNIDQEALVPTISPSQPAIDPVTLRFRKYSKVLLISGTLIFLQVAFQTGIPHIFLLVPGSLFALATASHRYPKVQDWLAIIASLAFVFAFILALTLESIVILCPIR